MRLLLLLLLLCPAAAVAQGTARLVADSVTVTAEERLVAEGDVEVFYDGARMTATRIVYDRAGDRLSIEGPILLETAEGAILVADRADLDPRLENGLLRGARLVLDRQLQLAAARLDRVDGRYSALTRTAATACRVCDGRAPIWEIRAARVVHDEVERQLYFENATFHIRGVPVLWVPRMRLPDPTLERSAGLLIPSIRTTDRLGVGLKLPYFVPLGPSRDLTLTPYLSTRTATLEALYRQAWTAGRLDVATAASRDDGTPGEGRAYLFVDGDWTLGPGRYLSFGIQAVSDEAYLEDYGYADRDRLRSHLSYASVAEDRLAVAGIAYWRTLREDEVQGALPPLVGRASLERRVPLADGTLTWEVSAESLLRPEDRPGLGRDVSRLGADLAFARQAILPGGLVLDAEASLEVGAYRIADDPAEGNVLRATPGLRTTLRWPLVRAAPSGTSEVLEPLVTLAWSETQGGAVPNEDSLVVEFDEGNLGAFSRFPGEDARETGARIALGASYTRYGADGTMLGLTFGRVLREEAEGTLSLASGLQGLASDWLVAARADLPFGLSAQARTVLDGSLDFDKTEARLAWASAAVDLGATYVYLPRAPTEGRLEKIAEWTLDGRWQVDPSWALSAAGRYDIAADRPVAAEVGIGWRNECVEVDVSVSRRYTSATGQDPVTDLGLSVNLLGFATGDGGAVPPGRCRG